MDDPAWLPIKRLLNSCGQDVLSVNNATAALLGGEKRLLKQLSLSRPKRGCAELVFLRTIFWISALLHECGGRALKFCIRQTQFSDPEGRSLSFLSELRSLRTQAAHNLDHGLACDLATETVCRNWFKHVCRTEYPTNDEQWCASSEEALTRATALLGKVASFLNVLKSMPDSDLLQEGLRMAISADISPYAFDDIVKSVANDLGRSDLHLEKFRADNLTRWTAALEKLPEGYDFLFEARRVVEKAFLESPERPPITGRDIIDILGVPQGREVSRLLEQATLLFNEGCRQKDALLDKLRRLVSTTAT